MICIVWAMLIKCWWMIYLINNSLAIFLLSPWKVFLVEQNQQQSETKSCSQSRQSSQGGEVEGQDSNKKDSWTECQISLIYSCLLNCIRSTGYLLICGFVGKFLKSLNSSIRNMIRRWGHGSNFRKIGRTAQNPLWVWTDTAHTRCGTYHLI